MLVSHERHCGYYIPPIAFYTFQWLEKFKEEKYFVSHENYREFGF